MKIVVSIKTGRTIMGRTRITYTLECGHEAYVTLPERYSQEVLERALTPKKKKCRLCEPRRLT